MQTECELITNEAINEFFGLDTDSYSSDTLTSYMAVFNENIKKLVDFYSVEDLFSLKEFLKSNEDMFILLNEIKPILKEFFPFENYILRIVEDPEFIENIKLMLVIKVDYSKEPIKSILNKLNKVNSKFRPIKRRYTNLNNIIIDVESLWVILVGKIIFI